MDNLSKRVERERVWHDERFSEDSRSDKTGKFYVALEEWYDDYSNKSSINNIEHCLELGAGLETIALSNQFDFKLKSIDISSKAVEHLNNVDIDNNAIFEMMDIHQMRYKSKSFDRIIGRGVLHHLDLSIALTEIKRVITDDGSIIFGEPLAGNPLINLYRWSTPSLRTPDEQPLSHSDLILIKENFKGAVITYYGFFTLVSAILGINFGRRYFRAIDNIILNKLSLGRFLAWACIIHN